MIPDLVWYLYAAVAIGAIAIYVLKRIIGINTSITGEGIGIYVVGVTVVGFVLGAANLLILGFVHSASQQEVWAIIGFWIVVMMVVTAVLKDPEQNDDEPP